MKHSHYTAADFAQDPSFQKWVLAHDQEANEYWSKWLLEHPEKKEEVHRAQALINTLEFGNDPETNAAFVEVWQNVSRKIVGKEKRLHTYVLVAACSSMLIILGFLYVWWADGTKTFTFKSGHIATTHLLPDSSVLMLNAHSALRYQVNEKGDRETWLEGEAYFEVKSYPQRSTTQPSSFIVHTDQADIEVLGTAFNLYEDNHKTQVVLKHGKVKVTSNQAQEIYLQPGEFAEVNAKDAEIRKKQVDTELYLSWANEKLKFDHTPLAEIAFWIEDRYEKKVLIPKGMDSITFSASFSKVDLGLLLDAIAVTYQVRIEERNDVIIISAL